jgi:hypothetical protein
MVPPLLEKGADVSIVDCSGETAVPHAARRSGYEGAMWLLTESGVQPLAW